MNKSFSHEFEDNGEGYLPYDITPIFPAEIKMSVDKNGNFNLCANKAGYLHLAKIFSEIGLRDLKRGFHFHKNSDFNFSQGMPEFTFTLKE